MQTRKTHENEQLYMPIMCFAAKDRRAGEAENVEQKQEKQANRASAWPQNEINLLGSPLGEHRIWIMVKG
ncbi:hypothetical protein, partial [Mycobacterium tuberculosis]|uniref:hypothetical protein n=1 Tax=Mycobacterium tuberculosis TaxID=1773 RepID=UPI001AEB9819